MNNDLDCSIIDLISDSDYSDEGGLSQDNDDANSQASNMIDLTQESPKKVMLMSEELSRDSQFSFNCSQRSQASATGQQSLFSMLKQKSSVASSAASTSVMLGKRTVSTGSSALPHAKKQVIEQAIILDEDSQSSKQSSSQPLASLQASSSDQQISRQSSAAGQLLPSSSAISLYSRLQQQSSQRTMPTASTSMFTSKAKAPNGSTSLPSKLHQPPASNNENNVNNSSQPLPPTEESQSSTIATTTAPTTNQFIRPVAGESYEVRLLVDRREKANSLVLAALQGRGAVRCEAATLAVGDFVWVARPSALCNAYADQETVAQQTLILPYAIVERKSIGDLASSLVDGRLREQQRRMALLHAKRRILMVEGESLTPPTQCNLQAGSLRTVLASLSQEGARVLRSRDLDHTAALLTALHTQVTASFQRDCHPDSRLQQDFPQCWSLAAFQQEFQNHGPDTVGKLFGHQLRQVSGLGGDGVSAIVEQYGSFLGLLGPPVSGMTVAEENEKRRRITKDLEGLKRRKKVGTESGRLGPAVAKRLIKVLMDTY